MKNISAVERDKIFRLLSIIGSDLRSSSNGLDRLDIAEMGDAIHNLSDDMNYQEFITDYIFPLVSHFDKKENLPDFLHPDFLHLARELINEIPS